MGKREQGGFSPIHIFRNIGFSGRMVLIYVIGGVIPFLSAIFFVNTQSRKGILSQNEQAQREEIAMVCADMEEAIDTAVRIVSDVCADETVKKLVARVAAGKYENRAQLDKACQKLQLIDDYLNYYENEISDIRFYVTNQKVSFNAYFSYISAEDSYKKRWYQPTCENNGEPYWGFYDDATSRKAMQVSQAILDEDGEVLGVLAVRLGAGKTADLITERSADTILIHKVNDVLATSVQIDESNRFVLTWLRDEEALDGSAVVENGVQEYQITYQRIYPDASGVSYTVVSVQNVQEMLTSAYRTGMLGFFFVTAGLVISVLLIFISSVIFGMRMDRLQKQMHYVATGQYALVEPIEGKDEIAQIDCELEKMMQDFQALTKKVVDEKVQKEKLHTKQREVEFKMLASQINPHFLYNTLETIRMKAKINHEPEIEELVKMLAKIMQRNIRVSDQMVTLASEIELIQNYLVIQGYRFGDRIRSEVIVDEAVDTQLMVVPLLMQPFVENAYVHGLESIKEDGLLSVSIGQEEETVVIEIRDNGCGMDYVQLANLRKSLREGKPMRQGHIGISNVNQRLRMLYGEQYGVMVQSVLGKGTCVTLRFPKSYNTEME